MKRIDPVKIVGSPKVLATTLVALLTLAPAAVRGQDDAVQRVLPHVRYFPSLLADPLEPRLAVGLLKTNLFVAAPEGRERPRGFFIPDPDDSASDTDAFTAIGGSLPFWQLKRWSETEGVTVGAQAGVLGRFRIEYPTREDVGQDWFVGMPIEYARGRWAGRFRIMHRSSHLGDELVETTGASRVEVGGEYADITAAYTVAPETQVYGGASWIFRSYTDKTQVLLEAGRKDRTLLQLGAQTGWFPWLDGRAGFVAGVDWRRAERTDWEDSFAMAGGLTVRTGSRQARLLVRYFTGASLLEQFFLTPEQYWSIELITDF